jgi:hypothetical protein
MTYDELVTTVQDYCENTFPTVDMNAMIRQAEQRIYNTVQLANLRKNMVGQLTNGNQYLSAPSDFLSTYSLAVIKANGDYVYLINKDVNFIREAYPASSATGIPKHYAIFGPVYGQETELSFILGPTPNTALLSSPNSAELHFYYYPESIIQGALGTLGAITAGSSYTNGTYTNVALTNVTGSGTTATANIVVSGNVVTSVTINNRGCKYVVGNSLSALAADIGGTGSGFAIAVSTVGNAAGTTWLGDNFDSALLNGTMMEAITYMKGEKDMVDLYQNRYIQAIASLKNLGDGKQRMDAYRDGQVRNPVS